METKTVASLAAAAIGTALFAGTLVAGPAAALTTTAADPDHGSGASSWQSGPGFHGRDGWVKSFIAKDAEQEEEERNDGSDNNGD